VSAVLQLFFSRVTTDKIRASVSAPLHCAGQQNVRNCAIS
jgi:hypothetical protein